jgi:hypothetical protein
MTTLLTDDLLTRFERRPAPAVADVARMSLERFARAGLVLEVRSSLFDEVVLFASDNARVPSGEKRTVYRAADLERIVKGRGDRI